MCLMKQECPKCWAPPVDQHGSAPVSTCYCLILHHDDRLVVGGEEVDAPCLELLLGQLSHMAFKARPGFWGFVRWTQLLLCNVVSEFARDGFDTTQPHTHMLHS